MEGYFGFRLSVMLSLIFLSLSWSCNSPTAPVSLPCQCGLRGFNRGSKIVGGSQAGRGEFPWQVGFIKKAPNFLVGDSRPFCGGSLINSKTVISAAHCFWDKNLNWIRFNFLVTLGDHDCKSSSDGELKVEWSKVMTLGSYQPQTSHDNDIAIVILKKHAMFNDWVKPICLPDPNVLYENREAVASGWGLLYSNAAHGPDFLQKVDLKTMSNKECNNIHNYGLTERMICASNPGKDTCSGDSGGPLVSTDGDFLKGRFLDFPSLGERYVLVGVTSFGGTKEEPCGNHPGVYVRVTKYVSWIQKNMDKEGIHCPGNRLRMTNSSLIQDTNVEDDMFMEVSVTNDKSGKP